MRSHQRVFRLCWLLLLPAFTFANERNAEHFFQVRQPAASRTVSGQITDNKNVPIQGVSVQLKGSNRGVTTDAQGRYSLPGIAASSTLVFSFTGFATQEVTAKDLGPALNITLREQTTNLNEVVVVGYGTRSKKEVTGAVSQVKVGQLENENPPTVQDALRGNVAGLSISPVGANGSDPSSASSAKGGGSLLVRGRSSINAGTSPLIVMDGVIYPGSLDDINPNDIATIDVLKDASSAAVFGAKSASGVILISTKRGSKSKPTITVNSNAGFGQVAINEPLYDGPGFVAWRTDVLNSSIVNHQPFQFNDPRALPDSISLDTWKAYDKSQGDPVDIWLTRLKLLAIERTNYKAGKTIDWYKMMFRSGFRQDHTISLSARKDELSFYLSGGYTNNKGIIRGDDYQVYRFRANLEAKVAKYLSIGLNAQFSDRDESQVPYSWGQMVNASPYGEIYRADGVTLRDSPNDDTGNNTNPFLDNVYTNRLKRYTTLFSSLYARGDLGWGFSYQINFTPNFSFYRYFNGQSAKDFRVSVRGGLATRTDSTSYNWQLDNLLKWNKTFGDHQFDVTFLVNAEKFQSWKNQMDNEGFTPNDRLSYHNISAGIKPTISSDDQYSTGDALLGRLNYTFKERYVLTASLRRDGYSAFGLQNPRATFPAVALGWIISDEKMLEQARWLNFAKLRISYGLNGNRDIGRYLALSDLNTGKYQFITPSGTTVLVSQLYVNRMANPGLKWEKTASLNLGFDFSVLNNRLGGSVDVYRKETKDLLVYRALTDVTGFSNILSNLGQVDNKGVEIALNSVNVAGRNFSWRSTATFALNRNKIVHLYPPVPVTDPATGKTTYVEKDDVLNKWFIGHDLNAIWDQKVLGVWQTADKAEAAKYNVYPGDFHVQDVNGDGKYTDADRLFVGNTNPKFRWSLRNEFTFLRNFDFSFLIYSLWGQDVAFNQAKNNSGFQNRQNSYKLPYWTDKNPINDYARLYSSNGSAGYSVYRKGSFIRLSTVAIAYTLPKEMVSKANVESLKIYANVNNAFVYQPGWSFWDVEYGNTPPPRYFQLGLNVAF